MKKQTETSYFGSPWQDIPEATRYNGGWTKSVFGVDRSKNNGYSIQGEFMGKEGDTYEISELYLDCDIRGSRSHQEKNYRLFTVEPYGAITVIATTGDSRGWALELWDAIEEFLGKAEPVNPLAQYTDDQIIDELARRGLHNQVR